jgi:biopolymer transport protein ExbD
MRIDLQDDEPVDVQMSPLIDCVFLLLIFFLVATTLRTIEVEVPIELPQPAIAPLAVAGPVPDDLLPIAVDATGSVFLRGNPVTQGVWVDELQRVGDMPEDERPPVRIAADRNAPWGQVLAIINTAEFYGLTDVQAQVTDPQATPE